jgi:hypothetical protein
MSARNIYHDAVVHALTADGWTITDDPLRVAFGGRNLYVDLGAEKALIAATKEQRRIAVEIRSFLNPSQTYDLHAAVGQFAIYRAIIRRSEPERVLYLAVPEHLHTELLVDEFGQAVISDMELRVLVFDASQERILRWIN